MTSSVLSVPSTNPVPVIPPYATMLGFTRYVTRTGPAKATFVGAVGVGIAHHRDAVQR